MKGTIAKALLEDAWRQVVDNKVFRLLVLVTAVPIAFTFVVGFRPEGIQLLWGWKELAYDELSAFFGGGSVRAADLREATIQGFQSAIVSFLGGFVGVIFCIAATAFFVPRMMEKGAADTLFSKPVSRFALLLSRYIAGLLFVGTLACVLILGVYLGLLVSSGWDDPGFLWGALTLIYLYAIVYPFTIAIATLTRSSAAAILLSLILFLFSGCVHTSWMHKEQAVQRDLANRPDRAAEPELQTDEEEPRKVKESEQHPIVRILILLLDAAHYVLPKTSEAHILTERLKRDVARRPPAFVDEEGGLRIQDAPRGFERAEADASGQEGRLAVWIGSRNGEERGGRVVLSRRGRQTEGRRRLSASRLADELEKEIAGGAGRASEPAREEVRAVGRSAPLVAWVEEGGEHRLRRERVFLQAGDWIYTVDFELDADGGEPGERVGWRAGFLQGFSVDSEGPAFGPGWSQETYGWNAPLRYNLFFSIGSSLAFALGMLGLAGLRIRSVDL